MSRQVTPPSDDSQVHVASAPCRRQRRLSVKRRTEPVAGRTGSKTEAQAFNIAVATGSMSQSRQSACQWLEGETLRAEAAHTMSRYSPVLPTAITTPGAASCE